MKIAILTMGSSGAHQLAHAAKMLGHEPMFGSFDTPQERAALMAADVFIPRVSHRLYAHALQLAGEYAAHKPHGKLAVTAAGIERSFDKYLAYEDMVAHGIPTPKTILVKDRTEAELLADKLPLIIKPRTENQGRNIGVVTTPTALADFAETLVNIYGSCIAQEFIAESSGRDIRAFVVGDRVVAAMERVAQEGSHLANLARGGSAKPIALTAEEQAIAVRAAHLFGATFAGVDILRSKNGPVVIEVNVSPGLKITDVTGIDIPTLIISHLTKENSID